MKAKNISATVHAGFGAADITPPAGTHLAGDAMGVYRPAMLVKNKLYAKASVFRSGRQTLCIIGLDVIIITEKYGNRIKDEIAADYGVDKDAIMVFAIQSHSAPSVGKLMMDEDYPLVFPKEKEYIGGAIDAYSDFAVEGAVKAARMAFQNIRRLRMDVKSGLSHGLAFCRRAITKDGGVAMPFPSANTTLGNPFGPNYIAYIESPADDEVGVASFTDDQMNLVGALLHFTCHPVNLFCNPATKQVVSPDWPGVWSEILQRRLNIENIPLVLNGCCGNVNPIDPFTPDYIMDVDRMSAALADMAEKIIYSVKADAGAAKDAVLDYKTFAIPLEYRDIPQERLDQVEKLLAGESYKLDPDGNANQDWFLAMSTRSTEYCRKREPKYLYIAQVFRIGDLVLVSMPGEPFTDAQLAIKVRSAAAFTYVTHCATKYAGYLAPERAYQFDGHETNFKYTYWAKFKPGSLEIITEEIIRQINLMMAK